MTPCELNVRAETFQERTKAESEERLVLAYLTARWSRAAKMPELDSILGKFKHESKKQKTDDQLLAAMERIHAVFGEEKEPENMSG